MLASTATFLAAACGGGTQSAPSGQAPAASRQLATIRLGERAQMEEEALNARLPVFKQSHPHITVERDVMTGDITQKVQTMAASGTLPDNVHAYLAGQAYHRFAIGGAFRDIESFISRDKFDLKPYIQPLVEYLRIDKKLHGLPFKGQISRIAFFYNVNLFQERGIPLPTESWTTDDLIKAAQQLTRRSGSETTQWGFALNAWGSSPFDAFTMPFDGYTMDLAGKKATIDSAGMLRALQWHENLIQRERVCVPFNNQPLGPALFDDGKVAMVGRVLFNYKSTNILPKAQFKWDGLLMPKGPNGKRGGTTTGDTQSVTRDTKAPDAAWELLKFMTDKEFGVALALQNKGSTALGGRHDVYADERILNHPQLPRGAQKAQLDSLKESSEPIRAAANYRDDDLFKVRDPYALKIANGETKADAAALRQLNTELQAVLDMPRT